MINVLNGFGLSDFNRDNTTAFVKASKDIVHQNNSVDEVIELLK